MKFKECLLTILKASVMMLVKRLGFITTTLEFAMQDKEPSRSLVPFMEGLLNKEEI